MLVKQLKCANWFSSKLCSLYKYYTNVNSLLIGGIHVDHAVPTPFIYAFTFLFVICLFPL